MFKHILVPLDGSMMAEAALPAAAFLSSEFKAVVTLFHVIEKNAPREVHGQPHLTSVDEATSYLKNTAMRAFPQGVRVNYHVHTTEAHDVAENIVHHADELHHDMIIMCSHGRGKTLHLLLGSIAQRIISLGSLPVLVIRPDKNGGVRKFSCKTVLVPLDGNPDHEQALPAARELAVSCSAALHLAMVIPGFENLSGEGAITSRFLPGTTAKLLEMSVLNAEEYLETQAEILKRQGVEVNAHVLRGDPATVIDTASRQLQIDLIVMASHGKSIMDAFWEGSLSHKVLSQTRVPLLLVPVHGG